MGLTHVNVPAFRVLDVWDPGRWEPLHGALAPQGDLGMDFPSQIKASFFLGDLFPMKTGPSLSSSRLPSRVTIPMAEAGSRSVQHHPQLSPDPGKIFFSQPPWTCRDSLGRAGSPGRGICPSQSVCSLWSQELLLGLGKERGTGGCARPEG